MHPERLLAVCHVLAAYRDEWNTRQTMLEHISYLNDKYHARIKLLQSPLIAISSHELRAKIRAGEPITGLVPAEVEAFIAKEGLYES